MGFHEIKSFCTERNCQQNKETAYKMEDNLCPLYPDKRLMSTVYRELQKTKIKHTKPSHHSVNKWANELDEM